VEYEGRLREYSVALKAGERVSPQQLSITNVTCLISVLNLLQLLEMTKEQLRHKDQLLYQQVRSPTHTQRRVTIKSEHKTSHSKVLCWI
jgi:hypothetical protein